MALGSRGKNVELRDQDLCNSPIFCKVLRRWLHGSLRTRVAQLSTEETHVAQSEQMTGTAPSILSAHCSSQNFLALCGTYRIVQLIQN